MFIDSFNFWNKQKMLNEYDKYLSDLESGITDYRHFEFCSKVHVMHIISAQNDSMYFTFIFTTSTY